MQDKNPSYIAGAVSIPFREDEAAHWYIIECLAKFYNHDYGKIPKPDKEANEAELKASEGRIVARYKAGPGLKEDISITACFSDKRPDREFNHTIVRYVSEC